MQEIDECIDQYLALSRSVFGIDNVMLSIPVGRDHCRFDEESLEAALKTVIKAKLGVENAPMSDRDDRPGFCPVFVVATEAQNAGAPTKLFRSYGFYRDECPIWQAARATSAAPTYFKPAFVDVPEPGGWYIDGGLKCNNPSAVALEEARNCWETVRRFCVVSIGTGRQRTVNFIENSIAKPLGASTGLRKMIDAAGERLSKIIPGATNASKISKIGPSILTLKAFAQELVTLSTNADDTHEEMLKIANSRDRQIHFSYYRFNIQRGMDTIGLEEWTKKSQIGALTRGYLQEKETQMAMAACVDNLVEPATVECM